MSGQFHRAGPPSPRPEWGEPPNVGSGRWVGAALNPASPPMLRMWTIEQAIAAGAHGPVHPRHSVDAVIAYADQLYRYVTEGPIRTLGDNAAEETIVAGTGPASTEG